MAINTRRNFAMPVFANIASTLEKPRMTTTVERTPVVSSTVPFKCMVPDAAMKYSEPQRIVAIKYVERTREIHVVGEDTNVRVCKIDRLPSIEFARELYANCKEAMNAGIDICFQAAGGFNPDRWFCDIVKG